MQFNSTPVNPGAEGSPSKISITPLAFLVDTLLATEEVWETLPDPLPLFLREGLEGLLALEVDE